jgi:hypothetical protein
MIEIEWHDPLCMLYENDYCCADCYTCQCHLIERVRKDEREKVNDLSNKEFRVAIEQVFPTNACMDPYVCCVPWHYPWSPDLSIEDGLKIAIKWKG